MSQFKVTFLGTPDFALPCLQKLIDDEHFDVVGVVTQPDRPAGRNMKVQSSAVKELALKHGIPVLTPEKISQSLEAIAEWQAETAVVVAFGQILPKSFLEMYKNRVVNVHASLLPRWRGAAPIQRAIMEGDDETGVSLQVVVPKLDAGPVLGMRKVSLASDLRAPELYDTLKALGPELIAGEYADWLRGMLVPREQDPSLVTIAPKIKKEEGLIVWNSAVEKVFNNFRGLYGWPGSHVMRNGKVLKIKSCRPVKESVKLAPGTVSEVADKWFRVACSSGQMEILRVQPESKSEIEVSEYLRGYPLKKGELL